MEIPSDIKLQKELSITLEVPIPPSINRLWRIGKNRKTGKAHLHRSPEYTRWLTAAGWELKKQLIPLTLKSIHGPYSLSIKLPEGKFDIDNMVKGVNDLLQAHHVIDNDRLCRKLIVLWGGQQVACRVEVRSEDHPASKGP